MYYQRQTRTETTGTPQGSKQSRLRQSDKRGISRKKKIVPKCQENETSKNKEQWQKNKISKCYIKMEILLICKMRNDCDDIYWR